MKNHRTHPRALRRAVASLLAFACLCAALPACGQELPTALKRDATLSPSNKDTYQKAAGDYVNAFNARGGNMPAAIQARNRLIDLTVAHIDFNFHNYQKKTRKRRAFFATLLDILEIGASTAISITNGERAKSLIAEGLGGLQLSRASIDKNFSLKETQILFNKMVAKRAQVRGNILRQQVQDVDRYSWETALIDLLAYYHAGTFDGAVESLSIDTGAEAAAETAKVERLEIATAAQLASAISLDDLVIDLFTDARSSNTTVSAPAITTLKNAMKALRRDGIATDLIPTDSEVDNLTVDQLDTLYANVRIKFVTDTAQRSNLQKLADLLKPPSN